MKRNFSWIQILLLLTGLFYAFSGLALLFAPAAFYETIGHFPPFNQHYMGDLGAFLLPLGLGLLVVMRDPAGNRTYLLVTAIASLLHALNHAYYDWQVGSSLTHWLSETIPLITLAILIFIAYRQTNRE